MKRQGVQLQETPEIQAICQHFYPHLCKERYFAKLYEQCNKDPDYVQTFDLWITKNHGATGFTTRSFWYGNPRLRGTRQKFWKETLIATEILFEGVAWVCFSLLRGFISQTKHQWHSLLSQILRNLPLWTYLGTKPTFFNPLNGTKKHPDLFLCGSHLPRSGSPQWTDLHEWKNYH